MNQNTSALIKSLKHPFKSRMFLIFNLPNAFFSGVRIRDVTENSCLVKNPFRSTYFACLSMAAEMSTGALCLVHLYKRNPPVSMLVVKVESEYFKKAIGRTTFTCEDGVLIRDTIERAISTGEAQTVKAKSVGKNSDGAVVAEFLVTWSFKVKSGPDSYRESKLKNGAL
ncbi:MAG: thioesterase [Bacteroidetes bacterium]|nr:MAG: thioesterase [Bacteroidota bacterium]